nr:MAG TPA: hypothetical protein [Caudoviricetes sp.]
MAVISIFITLSFLRGFQQSANVNVKRKCKLDFLKYNTFRVRFHQFCAMFLHFLFLLWSLKICFLAAGWPPIFESVFLNLVSCQ